MNDPNGTPDTIPTAAIPLEMPAIRLVATSTFCSGRRRLRARRVVAVARTASKPSTHRPSGDNAMGSKSKTQFTAQVDRKSTRLNSSHLVISYAVFCLKKKKYGYLQDRF